MSHRNPNPNIPGFGFDRATRVTEPVEIRLFNERLMNRGEVFVLIADVDDSGCIRANLTKNGHGTPNSLSNLQPHAVFPQKAVPGWQAEMIAAADSGLYDIEEVR
jgi:hypothetical protein